MGPVAVEVVRTVGIPVVRVGRGSGAEELGFVVMGGVGDLAGVGRRDVRLAVGAMMAQAT